MAAGRYGAAMTDRRAELHRELTAIKKTTDTTEDRGTVLAGIVAQGQVLADLLSLQPDSARPNFEGTNLDLYDWFSCNGVNEWLPENFETTVTADEITYTSFVWDEDGDGNSLRGWDTAHMTVVDGEQPEPVSRTVPLCAPLKDYVRKAFAAQGLRLVEA